MRKRQDTIATVIPCLCFLRMALTYIVPVRYCMNRGSANGAPAGGAFLVDIPTEAVAEVRGPDELRLLIFPQPLDGALKNQNAAPASPPCFRRRQTGCGTQHPLRLACVSLAAAPTTPRCFRRWRRSSSLQSALLLFESTLESETSVFYKTKSSAYFHTLSFFGGAKQPKSEPLPSGAPLAAISSKVMVFVPSL